MVGEEGPVLVPGDGGGRPGLVGNFTFQLQISSGQHFLAPGRLQLGFRHWNRRLDNARILCFAMKVLWGSQENF